MILTFWNFNSIHLHICAFKLAIIQGGKISNYRNKYSKEKSSAEADLPPPKNYKA